MLNTAAGEDAVIDTILARKKALEQRQTR